MLEKNPELGKPLAAILRGLRSLRIGDYRVIYQIKNALGATPHSYLMESAFFPFAFETSSHLSLNEL